MSSEKIIDNQSKSKRIENSAQHSNQVPSPKNPPNYLDLISEFQMMRNWIENNLDEIRNYLSTIEYPLFVIIYINLFCQGYKNESKAFFEKLKNYFKDHENELNELQNLQLSADTRNNPLMDKYLHNKVHIFIPERIFSFFTYFLTTQKMKNMIYFINKSFEISNILSKVDGQNEDNKFVLLNYTKEEVEKINSKTSIYYNKVSKEEMENAMKKYRTKSEEKSALSKVMIPYPENFYDFPLIDGASIKIDKNNAPSIGCFTLLNSNNKLNCVDIAKEGGIVACGFKDGSVVVWVVDNDIQLEINEDNIRDLDEFKDNDLVKYMEQQAKKEKDNSSNDIKMKDGGYNNQNSVVPMELEENNLKNEHPNDKENKNKPNNTEMNFKLDVSNTNFVYNLIANRNKNIIFYGHSEAVYSVSIEPTKVNIISGSFDGTIRLWNLHTKTCIGIYKGHFSPVLSVKFSPLSHYFASGGSDRTARLWSINTSTNLRLFAGHSSDVELVDFHPNGLYVISSANDKTIRLWTIQTGECARVFINYSSVGYINCLCFSNSGKLLAVGVDKGIIIYDIPKMGNPISIIKNLTSKNLTSIRFDNDDNVIVAATADYNLYFYDLDSILNSEDNLQIDNETEKKVDILYKYKTKKTTIMDIQFTKSNLMLMIGRFDDNDPKIFI